MSSSACTILGSATLALLLAGYLAQQYLPPPKPKIVGIDLGTTYSCIGVYHAGSGEVGILKDLDGNQCIPSIVAFNGDDVVVGYKAAALSERKPQNTFYDAKRFIGKKFTREELTSEASRYPFKLVRDEYGQVHYVISQDNNVTHVTPEDIGARILTTLRETAERNLTSRVTKAVMTVPAEFNEVQRNQTRMAARLAGIEVLRVINEPTAAALAYGLHKKNSVENVMVVDLGGGTLDVSLLRVQGGMFLTQAMAGNNHLGGQDFNQRIMKFCLQQIQKDYNKPLVDPEDLQALRAISEDVKLRLTDKPSVEVKLKLKSFTRRGGTPVFTHTITREKFEALNSDLFKKVLDPIHVVLQETEMTPDDIDEVVLVGGSTRIPRVRDLIREYFKKDPNVSIDPELAVVTGVAIQAGIIGGAWPLAVSATEIPTYVRKIHVR